VAVLASLEEGLGSVLAECQLHGLPVVATTAGGIPEVVAHGLSGLLAPPGDAPALAAHLDAVLTDPALRDRLGAGARRHGEGFLDTSMVAAYQDLYRELK
jgi:glycosyltransferase involved in cell wall biosynthesis